MGTFATPSGDTLIVQNHEQGSTGSPGVVAPASLTYDAAAQGGTSTLLVGSDGSLVSQVVSLGGTVSNCAGGMTPWGTWLTCEETEAKKGTSGYTKHHGWVFEVDPADPSRHPDPTPLTGLGRFPHEAAAVDPTSGDVYLTEDASSPNGLLYRFLPDDRSPRYGALRAGGTLLAMHVAGVDDLSVFTEPGTTLDVAWKPVPDASAAVLSTRKQFTYRNFSTGATVVGPGGAVTRSKKLEGLWWGRGRLFVVASFAHGRADWSDGTHDGQIWSYQPSSGKLRLEARFAPATDKDTMPDGPDNITVSPYGGLFVARCEDPVREHPGRGADPRGDGSVRVVPPTLSKTADG
jgi:secreted PhoX family phosphatase